VRDGTARMHLGVPEAVLSPGTATTRRDTTGRERPAKAKAAPTKATTPTPPAKPKRKQEPATGGGSQQARELRKRVQRLEKQWEEAEATVAAVQAEMADPALYEDADRVREVGERLDAAKDRAAELMHEWEQAATRLES